MPRINLLPWREEQRTERRNQFYAALGGALLGALVVIVAANLVMNSVIDRQYARNQLLKTEIAKLEKRIKDIDDLEDRKSRLLARMEIIEELQRSRPEEVHLFQEVAKAVPAGVYLTAMKQTGSRVEIDGAAESNTRVSTFMRNIDKSNWLTNPDLEVVEVKPSKTNQADRLSQFTVFAQQVTPGGDNDEEASQ